MQLLRDRVAQVYYTHGLFCASHPFSILVTVCTIIIILCYPLRYVPLPGNIPAEYVSKVKGYRPPPDMYSRFRRNEDGTDETSIPRWYRGAAAGYVQQIVVKTTVSPWEPTQHDPLDALRAPLKNMFKVLEDINKFRHQHKGEERSLVHCCLRVSEPLRSKHSDGILPQYGCLVVSPANLWHNNLDKFLADREILTTIHKRYDKTLEAPPGIRDLLFGLPWHQTGISRYFIRNRQRTISFSVTIVLKSYDESFVTSLRQSLEAAYPETLVNVNNSEIGHIVHLHYKDINIYFEYIHLIVLYLVLLMYLYFSVKKIEMVKSKWGLALSAVVTVVSSLLISVSVCSIFGMNTRLNGGEIFPYLVVLIGMENVLVVTKSVVSTSIELDVKYRVATGLSKEGWYITKNLLFELAIVLIGFFTFVPAIQLSEVHDYPSFFRILSGPGIIVNLLVTFGAFMPVFPNTLEFCLFAMVGLLTDFSLQMVFFVTVLSVDIRRMELSDLQKRKDESSSSKSSHQFEPLIRCPFKSEAAERASYQPRITLASGVSKLSNKGQQPDCPRVQHEVTFFQRDTLLGLPRRLRFIYFWASTRVVQRFIMVCSVVWIVLLVYKTGLVHHLTNSTYTINDTLIPSSVDDLEQIVKQQEQPNAVDGSKSGFQSLITSLWSQDSKDGGSVKHDQLEMWRHLSHAHWTTLFNHYNITIAGKYISVLPTIHLSVIIPPAEAIRLRVPTYSLSHQEESPRVATPGPKLPQKLVSPSHSKHKEDKADDHTEATSQQSSQEPDFLSEDYLRKYYPYMDPEQLKQYYPKSRTEFIITVSLIFLSVICLTYFILVLYRCMCSRKYSKWRASWSKAAKSSRGNSYYKQIKDALPLVLRGHLQEIECLVTDGSVIVSSCLGGQLRVWDSITGECLHVMQRKSATPPMKRKPCEGRNTEDSDADLYAEFHGYQEGENTPSESDITNISSVDVERPKPRHRRISEKQDPESPEHRSKKSSRSDRFGNMPDLSSTIQVKFTGETYEMKSESNKSEDNKNPGEISLHEVRRKEGFNFKERFEDTYKEHEKLLEAQRRRHKDNSQARTRAIRSKSEGEMMLEDPGGGDGVLQELSPPPIWCLACKGNLIIAGCGNGKIEFWDSTTGQLKCLYGESCVGVTGINFVSKSVIVARLDGSIDFLELETFLDPKISSTPLSPNSLNRKIKGHSRHLSHSRTGSDDMRLWGEIIHCTLVQRTPAHQRPITVLQTEGGRIVSGSQDFTLKVFRLEDYKCLYKLHGHTDCITCLYMDKRPPYAAVSGSADGTIRLWDLLSGTCVHKVIGHDGTVIGLTCTDAYIISSGLDDRMCVWERKRGHLLYSVDMDTSCGSCMAMLCNNFLVTGGQGSLYLWDVHKGELVRVIDLQTRDRTAFVHHIQAMENSTIVCDYGNEIKVIYFPLVLEKKD